MSFSEKLENVFNNIKTKYDLVAYCYYYLINTVKNQIIFLGEYIEINNDEQKDNPNYQMLSQFAINIKKLFKHNFISNFSEDVSADKIFDLVLSAENSLKDFGDKSMNHATIPFFILKGLDLYFQDCSYETSKSSPLNDYCKDFCLIYVNTDISILDEIMNVKNYAEIIHKNEIRSYFNHIIILETCELPRNCGIPKLIALQKNETNLKKIIETKKVRIALIPTMREKWFDFAIRQGASFEVEYNNQVLETVKNRVISLLKWAIECKANIIIFPEYICSEEIQSIISETLSQMCVSEPRKLNELLFVVAGSGWTKDSNNVSCIYDEDGFLLGRVYKYSAYDNRKNGIKYYERLQDPGKEITLIKVPRIGIFQIEICRNVSENEFCLKLAKIFDTQFLLITAWSSSVNIGFKKQIDSIVSSNHRTCTAMSNCCAAFSDSKKFRTQIGVVAAPQKNESLTEANFGYVKRQKQQCDNSCENGCIFEIIFDFSGENENDVMIHSVFRKKS